MISAADILRQLDDAARRFVFPMLDNGYVYPVEVGLTAYRASDRWAILIDVFGVSPRAGGIDACHNCVHAFGNCLSGEPGFSNDSILYPVSDGPSGAAVLEQYNESLAPEAHDLVIRGKVVPVSQDRSDYAVHGIQLRHPEAVHLSEAMRLLAIQHPGLLRATDGELRRCLSTPTPAFLAATEWHHPDVSAGDLPSAAEAFRSLAEALESGDPDRFQPGTPINTHWSHWPDGGTL